MEILKLTLKREWYELIQSGEKKEEYREIKDHWKRGLRDKETGELRKFDAVRFYNGAYFSEDLPNFEIECKGIRIGEGRPEWGAQPGVEYFIIQLGEIRTNGNRTEAAPQPDDSPKEQPTGVPEETGKGTEQKPEELTKNVKTKNDQDPDDKPKPEDGSQQAFEIFAKLYPIEAYDLDPAKFCEFFRFATPRGFHYTDQEIKDLIDSQRDEQTI